MAIYPNFTFYKPFYFINKNGVPLMTLVFELARNVVTEQNLVNENVVIDINIAKGTVKPSLQRLKAIAEKYDLRPFSYLKRAVEESMALENITYSEKIDILQQGIAVLEKCDLDDIQKQELKFFLDYIATSVDTGDKTDALHDNPTFMNRFTKIQ